jgi:putative hydrolase of the HAD superfamily
MQTEAVNLPSDFEINTFLYHFSYINSGLWRELDENKISHDHLRKVRFQKVLFAMGIEISEAFSLQLNQHFLETLPHQHHLMDDAFDVLEYLKPKYQLHILSNGYREVQTKKMHSAGILHFFENLFTVDNAKGKKPDKIFYDFAVETVGTNHKECIMIGDNLLTDIEGARNAGIRAIYFNPEIEETGIDTINQLLALKEIL